MAKLKYKQNSVTVTNGTAYIRDEDMGLAAVRLNHIESVLATDSEDEGYFILQIGLMTGEELEFVFDSEEIDDEDIIDLLTK